MAKARLAVHAHPEGLRAAVQVLGVQHLRLQARHPALLYLAARGGPEMKTKAKWMLCVKILLQTVCGFMLPKKTDIVLVSKHDI